MEFGETSPVLTGPWLGAGSPMLASWLIASMSPEHRFLAFSSGRQLFVDTIKRIAHRAESSMTSLAGKHLKRKDDAPISHPPTLRAIKYGLLGTHTMKGIAEKVGVSRATIGSWSTTFREEGIAEVLRTEFDQRGRKGKVNAEVQELLKNELTVGRFKRAKEVRVWLEDEHGIEMDLSGIYYR